MDLRALLSKGVHYGHQAWRWNPKMAPYIWGQKNGIHLIDISKTASQLQRAMGFLKGLASEGKEILWCGTKKAAQVAINKAGAETGSPIVSHRWIGGTLTNHAQVKKSVTKLLHLEDILAKAASHHYTKKELVVFNKMIARSTKNVGGIRSLAWPVGALVIVDVKKEHVAIREAIEQNIPIVALVDTNSDPSGIAYVIPSNDDAPQAIECIVEQLAAAVKEGKAVYKERKAQEVASRQTSASAAEAASAPVMVTPGEDKSLVEMQLAAVEESLKLEGNKKRVSSPSAGAARRPTGGQQRSGDRRGGARGHHTSSGPKAKR